MMQISWLYRGSTSGKYQREPSIEITHSLYFKAKAIAPQLEQVNWEEDKSREQVEEEQSCRGDEERRRMRN